MINISPNPTTSNTPKHNQPEVCMEEQVVAKEAQAAVNTAPETAIKSDSDYFERYGEICRLYEAKYSLLKKCAAEEKNAGDKDRLIADLNKLNQDVAVAEEIFWRQISEAVKTGTRFTFEEWCAKYSLCIFEKKTVLLLLYSNLISTCRNSYDDWEIAQLLNTCTSFFGRLSTAASFFSEEAALIKHSIIKRDKGGMWGQNNNIDLNTWVYSELLNKTAGTAEPDKDSVKKRMKKQYLDIGNTRDPQATFEDVIIDGPTKDKVCLFIDGYQNKRMNELGVFEKIKRSKGLTFLFYGPSGTGKSMLAEAIAARLSKKVVTVDCSKVMDRFMGETDKNIANMFHQDPDCLVIFDEADSLLYNRNYAEWEHDIRFVNNMLRELDQFEGIMVLTTNMGHLLDPAVERRISLKVEFKLPEAFTREKIWKSHIPNSIVCEENVDFHFLAEKYSFSGGGIKNAVLNALRKLAQREGNILTMDDLLFGVELEDSGRLQKTKERTVEGFSRTRIGG
jgi:AAA+ superfamily predicted ATPase